MASPEVADAGTSFEQYRPEVYAWAYRLLGRHHDALDAAQDVFLRWLAQSRRDLPDNPRGWLRRVTVNRAIDLIRLRREEREAGESRIEPASPGETDAIERDELRRDICAALERLTESQRSVLIAKVYDGLTFDQIAQEQGIAVPTAKTHYLRALSAVRGWISDRWDPRGAEHE